MLQCFLVELGSPGPEKSGHPAPLTQQSQCLLVKFGLLESQGGGAATESDIAVSVGEAGSWPRANSVDSTAAVADVKSAGKARPPEMGQHCAITEPGLA